MPAIHPYIEILQLYLHESSISSQSPLNSSWKPTINRESNVKTRVSITHNSNNCSYNNQVGISYYKTVYSYFTAMHSSDTNILITFCLTQCNALYMMLKFILLCCSLYCNAVADVFKLCNSPEHRCSRL